MGTRTITGRLARDPETRTTPGFTITTFTVMENTGSYRRGEWVPDEEPTAHRVEAKFELGDDARALTKGQAVIVIGSEHTNAWSDSEGRKRSNRVIDADVIGVNIRTAKRRAAAPAGESAGTDDDHRSSAAAGTTETAQPATTGWDVAPIGQANEPAARNPVAEEDAGLTNLIDTARARITQAEHDNDEDAHNRARAEYDRYEVERGALRQQQDRDRARNLDTSDWPATTNPNLRHDTAR